MSNKIQTKKLIALVLMLFPILSIVGIILYVLGSTEKFSLIELIVIILTIPFGFIAAIFLWLNALGIINL